MISDDEEPRDRAEWEAEIIKKMGIEILPDLPNEITHVADVDDWERIKENASKNHCPIVLYFSMEECLPCNYFAPIFKKIQEEFCDRMLFAHIDIHEFHEMVHVFRVSEAPTMSIIWRDREIEREVGVIPEDSLREMLQRALEKVRSQ